MDDDDDSPADAAFRAEARAWLAANVGPYRTRYDPANPSLVFADVSDTEHVARGKAWQRVLHEGGYAGLGWPEEYGGRDLPLSQRVIWAQETADGRRAAGDQPHRRRDGRADTPGPRHRRAEAPVPAAAPPRRRDLVPAVQRARRRHRPGRGHDHGRAPGATAASWAVSGHKLWTSAAHYADWGILLARTDWDVPKHQGVHVLPRRHEGAGRYHPTAAADDRRRRVQRGVPRRRACGRRSAGRGRGRRLVGGRDHPAGGAAQPRARPGPGRRRHPADAVRPASPRGGRRSRRAPAGGPALDRRQGAGAAGGADRVQAGPRRSPRRRGVGGAAGVDPGVPAQRRAARRHAGGGRDARRRVHPAPAVDPGDPHRRWDGGGPAQHRGRAGAWPAP